LRSEKERIEDIAQAIEQIIKFKVKAKKAFFGRVG
jgi:hypothetical protein